MKPLSPQSLLNRQRSIARCSLLFFMFVVLASACFAKAKRTVAAPSSAADTPSGFFPGAINYFAGGGSGAFVNGSVPTQVTIGGATITAADSLGNIYVAGGTSIYMVYAGGAIPATLANVTTKASPALTPQAGRIYQVGGLALGCGACEGMPLDQVVLVSINGLAIDGQDNLYYSDGDSKGDGEVVRKVDAATSNVTTVAGQWDVAGSPSFTGDGGLAISGALLDPTDIKLDSWGNLYIDDNFDDLVRVVYMGSQPPPILAAESISVGPGQKGYIYSVAGLVGYFCTTAGPPCDDGGLATATGLGFEFSIALDAAGNLYIADATYTPGPYIRVVYAGGAVPALLNLYLNPNGGDSTAPTNGYIYPATGYAANPAYGPCTSAGCGDGGLSSEMIFGNGNLFLTADTSGDLYISDFLAHAVRKIDTSNYASTIAGIDDPAQTPPAVIPVPGGGSAVGTYLDQPSAISFDGQDNLYIGDSGLVWIVAPLLGQTINFPAFNPSTVTYGAAPITLSATASSGLTVQYAVTSTPGGIAHLSGMQLIITGAGSITVTASQSGNQSYAAASPVTQTLTVTPAPLTVTAEPASKIKGQPNPAFSATISGFVNGDTAATPGVYSGAPAFSTTATTNSPPGTYPIVPSIGTLTATNYSFPAANFIAGTLTVTGSQFQSINFPPFSPAIVSYGQAPIALSATASSGGPVTFLLLSGPGVLSGTNDSTLTITGVGQIKVEALQEGNGQYAAAKPVEQVLQVNPAQLTVTGPTVTTIYGVTIDPHTFPPPTITGFVGNDTQSTVLTGSPQYTTISGAPDAGTYPITVGLGTLTLLPAAAGNYTFGALVNGSLIVQPAAQTIQFNPIPGGETYGSFVQLTAVSSSGLPVAFTESGPASSFNGVNSNIELSGVGTVTVTATQPGNGNYQPAPQVPQTFSVGPAPLTIGLAQAYSREQGAPNPVFQFTVQGFVLGDTDIPSVITGVPLLTTAATQSSPPGVYPIVPSQGTLSAANYNFIFVDGSLTVTPPGSFSITASPSSLSISSGLSGQATLTLTPTNFYQGTVTLSCGKVPTNVTCVISPSTYIFPGNQAPPGVAPIEYSAQGTITISASAAPVVGALQQGGSTSLAALRLVPSTVCGLLLLFARRRAAAKSGIWGVIAIFTLGAGLLAAASCGGSSHSVNAAPGTTQIMIQGSGTSVPGGSPVTASVPLTITVQ